MLKIESLSYSEPQDRHQHDRHPLLVHTDGGSGKRNLVILIHGLTGHRYGYWGRLPQFLFEDLKQSDIGLYYYATAWRRLDFLKSIDLEKEAKVLADELRQTSPYESITLIGHSMGGLLAKAAIASLINRGHSLTLQHITGLVLLASPQLGSMRVPRLFKLFTRDGRALYPHNRFISNIDEILCARLCIDKSINPLEKYNIPTWATIAAEDFWVDALSAGIGVPEAQKITVRGSHGSIINPASKAERTYEFLLDSLETSFRPAIGFGSDAEEILIDGARPDDIDNIRSLAVSFFGENVTPADVLSSFSSATGVLKVVRRVIENKAERRERFSGYFFLVPLSYEAAKDIKTGVIRGNHLTVAHMPTGSKRAAAMYVGAVAARDHHSRAIVLEGLRLHIEFSFANGIKEVLTRPLTPDGLRLVRKYNFQPLEGRGGLDKLYILSTTPERRTRRAKVKIRIKQ